MLQYYLTKLHKNNKTLTEKECFYLILGNNYKLYTKLINK